MFLDTVGRKFTKLIIDLLQKHKKHDICIQGYNISGFDLPIIVDEMIETFLKHNDYTV